ncbi:farnesyl pyrophosphate synthase-like [Diorhabda sublineata]|uniref:farnesyl pyrophosphate synthase-like n=1 Tax=Diorhabda sublineata TaxID=1163346 RepID=UPI0024E13BC9|nr:farnesyl pyrophosphate synthase-like [Diorhabda sublineata]
MYYNTHDINPRFLSRAIFTVHAYRLLEKPSLLTLDNIRKACILGWCHRMIDISIIIDDDIADDSKIRYNKPTWHQLDEVGINNAILDAAFIESAAHFLIINHFSNHPQYVNIHRELLGSYAHTNVAQLHEIKKPLYLANIVDTDAHAASKQICLDMARFQKIDDDVKGIMTPFSEKLKECTDISEGRTSWLAIEAYKRSNEAQRKILRDHYGKNNQNSVDKVYNLFEELRLVEVYENLREEFYEKTYSKIYELPKMLPPQLYIDLLNYIMSGNYLV